MEKAGVGRRFLAVIIDALIFFIFCFVVSKLVAVACGELQQPVCYSEVLDKVLSGTGDETTDIYTELTTCMASDEYLAYQAKTSQISTISGIICLIAFVGYFILLPLFWKKQTIGRLAGDIKVVIDDGSDVTAVKLILREIVGVLLIGILNCCCLIPLIVNIVLMCTKNTTIHDAIAGTKMVSQSIEVQASEDNSSAEQVNEEETYHF